MEANLGIIAGISFGIAFFQVHRIFGFFFFSLWSVVPEQMEPCCISRGLEYNYFFSNIKSSFCSFGQHLFPFSEHFTHKFRSLDVCVCEGGGGEGKLFLGNTWTDDFATQPS